MPDDKAEADVKAKPFKLVLTEAEMNTLMTVKGGEAVHKLQGVMKEQTADGKHTLSLNDMALGRVARLLVQGPKNIKEVLHKTVGRAMMDAIKP